jgi:hypothetical protein
MATRGIAHTIEFVVWDTSANAGKTGDNANLTLRWGKDGTNAAPTNASSEVDSTNKPGLYKVTLTTTETDCNVGVLGGKSSTANVVVIPTKIEFVYLPDALYGTSGGLPRHQDVDAILTDTNELQTDWTNGGRLDLLIDSILADTNELQTDWVNGGRLDLLLDATLADTNELQTDWTNGGRLDLLLDATLADTNELQVDWANGGRLDLLVDAILADTDSLDTTKITAARAAVLTDWIDGGRLDLLLDATLADTNELQGDWANGGRLDLLLDSTLADTNELQTDWANGGRLDLLLDATLADTNELQTDWVNGGRLDLLLDGVATPSQVNAEVVDALATDTYAEPGQGNPASTTTLALKIGYLYKAWRNRHTQTSSEYALYGDDAVTKDQEAAVSDDGTTFVRGEVGTGA